MIHTVCDEWRVILNILPKTNFQLFRIHQTECKQFSCNQYYQRNIQVSQKMDRPFCVEINHIFRVKNELSQC